MQMLSSILLAMILLRSNTTFISFASLFCENLLTYCEEFESSLPHITCNFYIRKYSEYVTGYSPMKNGRGLCAVVFFMSRCTTYYR
jgi:hypothetical protein